MRRIAPLVLVGCFSKPIVGTNDHLDAPVMLAAGPKHACRIDDAQRMWCWGNNDRGQLAQALTLAATGSAQLVPGEPGWTWIAAGDEHTCGIRAGIAYCWGFGTPDPEEVALPEPPRAIFAGAAGTCAITDEHHLYCWVATGAPAQVKPDGVESPWRAVALAADHTCALRDEDHSTYCWGDNGQGQLGGKSEAVATPEDAVKRGDFDYVAIAAGRDVTCAITVDRALACWGAPARTNATAEKPDGALDSTRRWTAVAVGERHVCAVGDGGVHCSGDDDRGARGPSDAAAGVAVIAAARVIAGDGFSCSQDGSSVSCWGTNEYGELGNHEIATQRMPVATGRKASRLALGPTTTCATDGSQMLACWGDNRAGQIDPGGERLITRPVVIGPFQVAAAGARHTCAITNDASAIECWGVNDAGQLGVTDPEANRARVVASTLPNTTRFVDIAAGARSTCAITDRNEVACWGALPGGATQRPPTLLNGTYDRVAVGNGFAIVSATPSPRDTLVVGAIADCIDATSFPSAQPIIAGQTSSTIALAAQADASHVCVLEDGRMICAGRNDAGQTAHANTTSCQSPAIVPAPAGATWGSSVTVGGDHSCAIDGAGRMYCWGANLHGELAGIASGKTTPQLLDGKTWSRVATSTSHSCGIDANSDVYCWGENRFGEVGVGTSYRATPTEVVP